MSVAETAKAVWTRTPSRTLAAGGSDVADTVAKRIARAIWSRNPNRLTTPPVVSPGTHYFLDVTAGGFWRDTFPAAMQPTCCVRYAEGSTEETAILLGCFDGYIRKFDTSATDDDGTAFVSSVVYGPLRVAGPGYMGQIAQIAADLETDGQGVNWGIVAGDTAEQAVAAAVAAEVATLAPWNGSWGGGMNHREYPRAYGAAFCIMVSGSYGWAIEGMRIESRAMGAIR